MKERTEEGVGVVKSDAPIDLSMEDRMWSAGILGKHNPKQLCDTMLFLIGVNLALRGGEEHKKLRRAGVDPQIQVSEDSDGVECLKYFADAKSKISQGGLTTKFHEPKIVQSRFFPMLANIV